MIDKYLNKKYDDDDDLMLGKSGSLYPASKVFIRISYLQSIFILF